MWGHPALLTNLGIDKEAKIAGSARAVALELTREPITDLRKRCGG